MVKLIAEIMAYIVQAYISASFVCRIFRVKTPYRKSFFAVLVQILFSYILVNYIFFATPKQRILSGIVVFTLIGFCLFEGSRAFQMICSIAEYSLFLLLDLMLQFLIFSSFSDVIFSLPVMEQKLLGRNLATATLFLVYMMFEIFLNWKQEKQLRGIFALGAGLGLIQMLILDILSKSNSVGMLKNRNIITIFFNVIMIGGYFVVMEMFRAIQRQQQKQSELEQISLERWYQYDYYQKAYTRSEEIRDMRHDMRNQLQAIQYLFQSEEDESRRRAEEMVNQLCGKVNE